jgi:hypothetical protein
VHIESKSISSSAQCVTLQVKIREGMSTHAGLAQQNSFGPAFLHSLVSLVKGKAKPNTRKRRV